jgi:Response regulator containing a CheY-like receiver domain and an HTH DNA-binding domain
MNLTIALLVHPEVVQLGIRTIVEDVDPNVKIVLMAANEDSFYAIWKHGVDMLILDHLLYKLLEQKGALGENVSGNNEIIVIGNQNHVRDLSTAVGYISSQWSVNQLRERIQTFITSRKKALGSEDSEEVTSRERDIIRDIALGLSSKEIADKNFISPHTVITHRKNIARKLGIKSISGLTIYAIVNKLISIEDVKNVEL